MPPTKGVTVKRHEFRRKDLPGNVFVVFEGAADTPFWNRAGDGIRFVFTNLSYSQALDYAKQGILIHTIVECDGDEFERYRQEAEQKHHKAAEQATKAAEGWTVRTKKNSRALHYFVNGVSVCPRHWDDPKEPLSRDRKPPKGIKCPDCVELVNQANAVSLAKRYQPSK